MSAEREALEALARIAAPYIAREVVAMLRAGELPGMVDQAASPLGRRRHIAAVRRRVEAGDGGAAIVGRRYLLERAALDAELAALANRPRKARKGKADAAAAPADLDALRERYGLREAS